MSKERWRIYWEESDKDALQSDENEAPSWIHSVLGDRYEHLINLPDLKVSYWPGIGDKSDLVISVKENK